MSELKIEKPTSTWEPDGIDYAISLESRGFYAEAKKLRELEATKAELLHALKWLTPSDKRIMEVARRHWKMPGNDVIAFVRELLG